MPYGCLLFIFREGRKLCVGYVAHDILHLAAKNSAKHVNGVGTDTFVSLQACNLSGTDMIPVDQGILRNSFFFHNVPEVIIRNHRFTISLLPDIITECGV